MSITSNIFFNSYQYILGETYAKGYEEVNNPSSTLQTYIGARQLFLGNLGANEVVNGLNVVNSELLAETTYTNAATTIVKNPLQTLKTFFNNTYGVFTRDYFNSLSTSTTVQWSNSFKEAWYQSNAEELVQQIGFASFNGANLVLYPATSSVTNVQNSANIIAASGNNVTISGYVNTIANYALPGYIVVAANGSVPPASSISLGTTVVGFNSSTSLILSGPVGSATSLFAFRPLKNPEYLEFRFGTSSVTGLAATSILSDIYLNVTLTGGSITTSVPVYLAAANVYGRVNIGTYGNTIFKATSILNMSLVSGSYASLGTQQSLEIWVKSTY